MNDKNMNDKNVIRKNLVGYGYNLTNSVIKRDVGDEEYVLVFFEDGTVSVTSDTIFARVSPKVSILDHIIYLWIEKDLGSRIDHEFNRGIKFDNSSKLLNNIIDDYLNMNVVGCFFPVK